MESKIRELIDSSRRVILDCCLENGAIVAANCVKPYYPRDVKNYFYVWPRDASYTCMAADVLGLDDVAERFFDWIIDRAEGWQETGLLYEKYYPNGLKALNRFQPDQTGTLLYAAGCHFKDKKMPDRYRKLVTDSAEGLCRVWNKDHFTEITNDLWEERLTFPDLKENFSYSLAACIGGLISADQILPNERYVRTADEMKKTLLDNAEEKGFFQRSFGRLDDARIDASLLGVIWPFRVVDADNPLAKQTVGLIEEKLVKDYGVYRYENDEYDGWILEGLHRNKGAGFWPLLNYWMSTILNMMGEKEKAKRYYWKAAESSSEYIPEQVFDNRIQKSVCPLCWSHTMFVLASKELELI